jgi:hypothetical protein
MTDNLEMGPGVDTAPRGPLLLLSPAVGVAVAPRRVSRPLLSISPINGNPTVMVPDPQEIPRHARRGICQFLYDAPSDTLEPNGNDAVCGYACHTTAAAKDYIFTAYPQR